MDAYDSPHKAAAVEMGEFGPVHGGTSPSGSRRDELVLARLGKKPVLKRNFGFMSILGFSCTILITWEGSLMCVPEVLERKTVIIADLSAVLSSRDYKSMDFHTASTC